MLHKSLVKTYDLKSEPLLHQEKIDLVGSKGPFNNYVEQSLPNLTHLPISLLVHVVYRLPSNGSSIFKFSSWNFADGIRIAQEFRPELFS